MGKIPATMLIVGSVFIFYFFYVNNNADTMRQDCLAGSNAACVKMDEKYK